MGRARDIINEHFMGKRKVSNHRKKINLDEMVVGAYGLLKGEVVRIAEKGKFERMGFNMLNDKMLKKHGVKLAELPTILTLWL